LGLGFKEPQSDRGEERTGTKKKGVSGRKLRKLRFQGKVRRREGE
jgi:hypothetical protein